MSGLRRGTATNLSAATGAMPAPTPTPTPTPTPATRAFANPNRVPGWNTLGLSNGTDTAQMSRKGYRNEQTFAVGGAPAPIQIGYAGRYQTAGAQEADNPGAVTVSAWLEYPAGTYTALTFGGGGTGTAPVGGATFLLSDPATLAAPVPAGGQFWVWSLASVSSGTWPFSYTVNSVVGDKVERGAAGALANMTPGGAMATGTGNLYAPAIVRTTTALGLKNVLCTFGDSIVSSNDAGTGDGSGNLAYVGRACSGQIPMLHASVAGTTMTNLVGNGAGPELTRSAMRRAWMEACGVTDCYSNYGTNDIAAGSTLSQLQALVQNEVTMFRGVPTVQRVHLATIGPRTNEPPLVQANYETAPTQAVPSTPAGAFSPVATSVRVQYNGWLRSGAVGSITGLTDAWDVADLIEVNSAGVLTRNGGYWITGQENPGTHLGGSGTARRATQDGLHPIVTNYGTEQGGLYILRDGIAGYVAAVKTA